MTFTFDNESAYQSAKASGGSVYNAVYGSSEYAAAAVSYIKSIGRSVVDAKNVIVDRDKGQVGDILLYKGGSYFWCKSLAGWNASSLGQTMGRADQLGSAGYYIVGWCARKRGRECLIISYGGDTTGAWSSNTYSTISGVFTETGVLRADGVNTWIASANSWLPERTYGNSTYTYTWPIPRQTWDAACAVERAGSGSGTSSDGVASYSMDGTRVKITSTWTDGALTVYPQDWGYDFDRWYNSVIRVRRPATVGVLRANHGRANTRALVASGTSAAANHCNSFAISGVTDFGAGKWWLGCTEEMTDVADAVKILNERGAGLVYDAYWTSDQYNASYAWYVGLLNGHVHYDTKTRGLRVRPVSAFTI